MSIILWIFRPHTDHLRLYRVFPYIKKETPLRAFLPFKTVRILAPPHPPKFSFSNQISGGVPLGKLGFLAFYSP